MSQPFALPLKILYHITIEKERNKCEKSLQEALKEEFSM